jgi:hypothetical protein
VNADYSAGADQDQQIFEDATISACGDSNRVVIRAEAGTRPVFRHIRLGDFVGNCGTNSPDNLTIMGFAVVWGVDVEHDAQNITIDDFAGGAFGVGGNCGAQGAPVNVLISNSEWGPCESNGGTGVDCRNQYTDDPGEGKNKISDGANVIVDGNVIHDFIITDENHFECIWSNGGDDVEIRNNWFYNCVTNHIALDSQGMTGTWIFENNWFGYNQSANAGLKWGLNTSCPSGTVIIRFNSFAEGSSAGNEDDNLTCSNIYYIGNIFGERYSCESGAVYSYNLYRDASTCSGTGDQTIASMPYVNDDDLDAADYHLTGTTVADELVPGSVTNSGLATDREGDVRSAPRDAGADER